MTALLDANVLIALTVDEHVHHDVVQDWFASRPNEPFATCPLTQGALVRFLLRNGADASVAIDVIGSLIGHDAHEFWPADLGYDTVRLRGVVGHRQVTDAYLAALARDRAGRLVTLDRGVGALHDDVALLIDGSA